MSFPLSAHGRIRVERTDMSRAVGAVEALLRETKASSIAVGADRIDFGVRFLRLVGNWNLLVPIDSGSVAFRQSDDDLEVQYSISFKRFFFVVTAMIVIVSAIISVFAVDARAAGFVFVPVAWFSVFALNYLIAVLRFPAALRSSLHASPSQRPSTERA
ncbi:MAG: hypothetical protein QOF24_1628 [Verrucomicrobiota bacterium]|jgi:hypothetical protein